MGKKFYSTVFICVLISVVDIFVVLLPSIRSLKESIGLYIYNKVTSTRIMDFHSMGLYDLPPALSLLPHSSQVLRVSEVTYGEDNLESDSSSFVTDDEKDNLDYNDLNYIDFRVFLDNLFYGDFSELGWKDWNKDEYYIHSYIVKLEPGYLTIYVMYPEGKTFSGAQKRVKVECTRENSVLLSGENFELLDTGIDIFFEAKKDDGFFVYCLDENCNAVGNSCVLVRPVDYE